MLSLFLKIYICFNKLCLRSSLYNLFKSKPQKSPNKVEGIGSWNSQSSSANQVAQKKFRRKWRGFTKSLIKRRLFALEDEKWQLLSTAKWSQTLLKKQKPTNKRYFFLHG